MSQSAAVRRVDLPVETVWKVLSDHRGMASWGPGLSVELEREGDPAPNGVGAVRYIKGPATRIREEVTGFEANKRLAYKALSGVPLPNYHGTVELAPGDGNTTIRWSLSSSLPASGPLLRVLATVLLGTFVRALGKLA